MYKHPSPDSAELSYSKAGLPLVESVLISANLTNQTETELFCAIEQVSLNLKEVDIIK